MLEYSFKEFGMEHRYTLNGTEHIGYLTTPEPTQTPGPLVMIFHDWAGCHAGMQTHAAWLTDLGYRAFVCDLYGGGQQGHDDTTCMRLIEPHFNDPHAYRKTLLATLAYAKTLNGVEPDQIAIIGFCFGGYSVLELARAGGEFALGFSVHGLFDTQLPMTSCPHPKLHLLHGFQDPMADLDKTNQLIAECAAVNAHWELLYFSQASHAFTNPNANDPLTGKMYDASITATCRNHIAFALQQLQSKG
jgi:dienelactone hydrolase